MQFQDIRSKCVRQRRFRVRVLPWLALSCFLAAHAWAEEEEATIYDLNLLDKNHLHKQVERIDELARIELGTQVRGTRDDLELLQRIVNRGLIDSKDRLALQAMGAVLGNLLVNEIGLEWKIYEDALGRSRATCVKQTQHCLFPITMLSRRMEVGIIVNVSDIYNYAVEVITPYLPKDPFDSSPAAPGSP